LLSLKARERFSTSILAETGEKKGMNIRIVNSPPSPKQRRKGAEYRSVRVACFYDDLVANDADLSTYSDDKDKMRRKNTFVIHKFHWLFKPIE